MLGWVLLGAIFFASAPEFEVKALSARGEDLPELTEAISRALVAGGARVVLGGSGPCDRCVRILVKPGIGQRYRITLTEEGEDRTFTATLPESSALLDRARALAVQIRLASPLSKGSEHRILPKAKPKVMARVPASREAALPPADEVEKDEADRSLLPAALAQPAPPLPTPDKPPVVASAERSTPGPSVKALPAASAVAQTPRTPVLTKVPASPPEAQAEAKDAVRVAQKAPQLIPSASPRWPYIPLLLGGVAALSAGTCAYLARDRYAGLADRTQTLTEARRLKSEGETLQSASYVLSGVALAGITTGILGLWQTGRRTPAVRLAARIEPDGAFFGLERNLP